MELLKSAKIRNVKVDKELRETVSSIINDVIERGDDALRDYTRRFEGFWPESFKVPETDIRKSYEEVSEEEIEDLRSALANIKAFAEAQKGSLSPIEDFQPKPGIHLSHRVIPVESCLCYVPGGSYPLFSTALMLITPAKVAGVGRVCACSPMNPETGSIDPRTLVAMDLAGADEIYAVGGAHAIAAFSYGTSTIDPVDLIVGPGNKYVAEAKRQCYGQVGIDFIAGPSEVLVITDGSSSPEVVACDLLAQAEHDVNAKAFLLDLDRDHAEAVLAAVEDTLKDLPTAGIARISWDDYGEAAVADDIEEAIAIANKYAPEHLEFNVKDPDEYIDRLINYGSLFIGGNTAEVFGDYASGTNHTLPTIKAARYTGGVWVGTFLKVVTGQRMSDSASRDIAPLVERLAKGEGLMAHALAASKRK